VTTIRFARVKQYTVDGWRDYAFAPETDPEPPPEDDDPGGWAEAFDASDFYSVGGVIQGETIDWFVENTGHNPGLSYQYVDGHLTVTDSWLSTNLGNGRVTSSGGRYYVERYQVGGALRITSNNVTFDNMYINVDRNPIFYAIQASSGQNPTGIEINNTTLAGNQLETSGASINFPLATSPNQIVFRQCDFSGHRAGIYCFGGISAHYCYVHDLIYAPESHNTGASLRARNNWIRRCCIVDGNSAAISMYAENSPYTGILIEENILRLAETDTGAEMLLGKEYEVPQPGETRIVRNNKFYRGNLSDGVLSYTTTLTGNVDIDGTPVP